MSLTTQDLTAIKQIVDDRLDTADQINAIAFNEVFSRLDNLDDDMREVKTDLASVQNDILIVQHDLGDIQQTVGRIETVQQSEVSRSDRHEVVIRRLSKNLPAV